MLFDCAQCVQLDNLLTLKYILFNLGHELVFFIIMFFHYSMGEIHYKQQKQQKWKKLSNLSNVVI